MLNLSIVANKERHHCCRQKTGLCLHEGREDGRSVVEIVLQFIGKAQYYDDDDLFNNKY
jgi:hypothetical protein